jgi:hypothetical protein
MTVCHCPQLKNSKTFGRPSLFADGKNRTSRVELDQSACGAGIGFSKLPPSGERRPSPVGFVSGLSRQLETFRRESSIPRRKAASTKVTYSGSV